MTTLAFGAGLILGGFLVHFHLKRSQAFTLKCAEIEASHAKENAACRKQRTEQLEAQLDQYKVLYGMATGGTPSLPGGPSRWN